MRGVFEMLKLFLKLARKLYCIISRSAIEFNMCDYEGATANGLIKSFIISDKPCMIARLGRNEMAVMLTYLSTIDNESCFSKILKYIKNENHALWYWDNQTKSNILNNAGFFPSDETHLVKFSEMMLANIQDIDILGSWLRGEVTLSKFLNRTKKVHLKDLEPYYHKDPWSELLRGKKVLVVHPFTELIKKQYLKRKLLFKDHRVLPEFDLLTIKAVQSIAGTKVNFLTWFDALNWMCGEISKKDFDIAIIGAGAYGLPLASYVKSIGKKGIHLGGATQILFGIKGKR